MDKYIVMTAEAKMPSKCRGKYGRIAIVETDGINLPKQINPTHKSVIRIVRSWERLNIGKTDKCAFKKALIEANDICKELNMAGV